jgi:transcriptional regulator with XRE-family HTH domain
MDILRLGQLVRDRRGDKGVRAAAAEAGVSAATLSRVERGHLPDILTYQRLCAWLRIDPETLDAEALAPAAAPREFLPSVHLRADATYTPQTASDLATLILVAHAEITRRNL